MGQSKKWPRWFAVIKKRQTKCLCKSVYSFSNYSKKMRIRCVHQIRSDKTDCQHSARLLQHIAMALDLMSSLCGLVSDTRHFEIQHESPDWDASVQIWFKSHFQNTPKCGLNFICKSCTFWIKLDTIWVLQKKKKKNWACNQTKQLNNLRMLGCRISSWTANANC